VSWSGWVGNLADRVGSGQEKWTRGQLCYSSTAER